MCMISRSMVSTYHPGDEGNRSARMAALRTRSCRSGSSVASISGRSSSTISEPVSLLAVVKRRFSAPPAMDESGSVMHAMMVLRCLAMAREIWYGCDRRPRFSRARYRRFASRTARNRTIRLTTSSISSSSSMDTAVAAASKTIAWTALFLLGFFTGSFPVIMSLMACFRLLRTPGSSGAGKYCSARRIFTWSHGVGMP